MSNNRSDFYDLGMGDSLPKIDASKVKKKDKEKFLRMRKRINKVPYMIYPED